MKPELIYHIYNRCNGKEKMFIEDRNYSFFILKLQSYVTPVAEIIAYCLMSNHFHLLVRIKPVDEISKIFPNLKGLEKIELFISKQFSNFFSCYTLSFNKVYRRKGSLFMKNFKRKEVDSKKYFMKLFYYIHSNPVNHGYATNLAEWKWSSYKNYLNSKKSFLNFEVAIYFFDSMENLISFHENLFFLLDPSEEIQLGKVFNFGKV